jgi:hypothetical protein
MKVLIILSCIVVFISAFFILFTTNALGERHFECNGPPEDRVCEIKELNGTFGFGVSIIAFFVLLSLSTMYITFKTLKESTEA